MEKSLDEKENDHVQFIPDGWQRDIFNILDKNESVIVVTPISTEKTFIVPTLHSFPNSRCTMQWQRSFIETIMEF